MGYSALCAWLIFIQGCTGAQTVTYGVGQDTGTALLCRPEGDGPFPAVIYNHGLIVDQRGYAGAMRRGYDMEGICAALANDGFLAFAPIRTSGMHALPRHAMEVSRAVDYVESLPDVDPSRIALMGMSRGGLLTLMVGVKRRDLQALVIMAPAPGGGQFKKAVDRVPHLNTPVLLLVEAGDGSDILQDFTLLKEALDKYDKDGQAVLYDKGGGHKLFYRVNYYWDDVRVFLSEKLSEGGSGEKASRSKAGSATAASAPAPQSAQSAMVGPRGYTAKQAIARHDRNGDARLGRDEFRGPPSAFDRIDTDGDQFLTPEELETFWRARGFGTTGN